MSKTGRGRGRLVAERRYPNSSSSKGTGTGAKPRTSGGKRAQSGRSARSSSRRGARRGGGGGRGGISGAARGIVGFFARLIWIVTSRVALVAAIVLAVAVGLTYATLPSLDDLLDGRAQGSVTMLDREGRVFAWRGDQFGGAVRAEQVSPHLKNAIIATEDRRFYWHPGVSPRGVASAIRINLREGRGPLQGHGGSTITQQTAKLLCLGREYDASEWESEAAYVADCRETSIARKAKEAIYAMAMEAKYSKDDILSIYLNRAYMGGGAYGAEAASQRYFSKPASALRPAEAAMIAGLLTAPTSLAPTNSIERSRARANVVIGLMEDEDYLTAAEAEEARNNPASLSDEAEERRGGYFADWIMDTLPPFVNVESRQDVDIRTTLDPRIQSAVEDAMNTVFENKVREGSEAQAAIVVMSADGAVRGMVGGRKTGVSGVFNRATQAVRQTGSAFKPFVYATALELGRSPYDTVVDEPFCMNIPGSGQWCPQNYTRNYSGTVTLTDALKRSLNIPAVKVSESAGRDLVAKVATDFGIDSDVVDTPSVALGVSEATLLEMTGAYAGILNGGSSVQPYGIESLTIKGDDKPLVGRRGGMGERVIREEAAKQLVFMLEKVVAEGTGRSARLPDRQAAGKTGTSNEQRDAWFVGFTADYVAGVWMGYDDNTPLTGVTGGGLPADIWREAMTRIHDGMPARPLPMMQPTPPQRTVEQQPAPQPQQQPQPQRQPQQQTDAVGDFVGRVLRDIFGN
ncbi:glycosyl transferase [Roseivivax halodurans JCM 10272]|uniref:peptidoglycan glycosyltransferase n=1 Tax=Roseivivax halodurans JCM 10272 TaxID=1449350 RepID=X7EFE4_9RHOB|nr:PBP1A family penicillin-binding protein [Roseivivax halodurans]ETX13833.1 glycosyl transferase [Roseivivax halodurans JCM 10272]